MVFDFGGETGIRTLGTFNSTHTFQACALDRSAISPKFLTKIHGGGARDRKSKLLDKQTKGKARGKQFGKVEIPQEAFIGVLKINIFKFI